MIAWSYGGGVQSVAIAVLIREGKLPLPDLAVIADTGRERRTTWDYLRDVVQPYLKPVGLTIQVAPHTLARVDLYAKDGLTLMPAYTTAGRLPAYCSGEWKRDVCERWLRLQGVKEADQWIGYSFDERGRVKKDHRPWLHNQFPLIDLRITRYGCTQLIEKAGLPPAHKSRCWSCPHQTAEEWQQVRDDPEEWAAAVALDEQIRECDPEMRGDLYLYSGRKPLPLADFQADMPEVPPLFRACEGASCWT